MDYLCASRITIPMIHLIDTLRINTMTQPVSKSAVQFARAAMLTIAAIGFTLGQQAAGQGLEFVKAHYTKYEYRIPMRDGKKLFTAVYVPKDQSQRYPMMLTRTPYDVGPYGADEYKSDLGPSPLFGKEGYIFVYQDVRGRWMS